jgi:sulfate adenylyltransferase subunit 2
MLHLAWKAFHPRPVPLPLRHVDTAREFWAMYEFRDETARRLGLE